MNWRQKWLYPVGAIILVVLLMIGCSKTAFGRQTQWHRSVASVFDIDGEPQLACKRYKGLTVAHRSLPCGTRVRFMYNGHKTTARVSDRGPYANGAEWDLDRELQYALHAPYGVYQVHWRILK